MTRVLYQYRPGSIRSLALLLCAEMERDAKAAYSANALWMIIQYLSMGKSTLPPFHEAFPRHERREPEPTAQEIIDGLVRKLRE